MAFTWEFDAPTGVYKSRAMSSQLLEAAIEKTVLASYARSANDGFGAGMGESVSLTRLHNMGERTSVVLSESMRIPENNIAISTKAITVEEIGDAVPFTNMSQQLGKFDPESLIQKQLMNTMTLSLDTLAAAAFKSTALKYSIDGAASSTTSTSGAFGSTSAANLNVYHLEEIRDLMFDTYWVAPYEGDDYVGIFRTLALRGIKRDAAFEDWFKYTEPALKRNSEVGRVESIRLVETNHNNAFGKVGTGSVLGEGVVFGEDPIALAEAQSPELRAQMNVGDDFGRQHAVAWYGILKYDIVWETADPGEVRVLHVGSL